MRSAAIAVLAVLACLAAAVPASAQEPTLDVSVTCEIDGNPFFTVQASGLNPGETGGVWVEDTGGAGHLAATAGPTDATGSYQVLVGGSMPNGTYTLYAYTGPWQTFGDASGLPFAVHVDQFDPSLTTSLVSTVVEVACGPPSKEECKLGGYLDEGFRNQGLCISASAPGRQ